MLVVHNETSTGVTSDVRAVGAAIEDAEHDALLWNVVRLDLTPAESAAKEPAGDKAESGKSASDGTSGEGEATS